MPETRDQKTTWAGQPARPGLLPRPGQAAPGNSETAGQPPVPTGPGTRPRDYTPSPALPEPQIRQGRGKRAQEHVESINDAPTLIGAAKESLHTLTSVLTQAIKENPESGDGWARTVIHLVDGLNVLIEHGTTPHSWFRQPGSRRLNPDGWAPPAALTQVAARVAGQRRQKNGES